MKLLNNIGKCDSVLYFFETSNGDISFVARTPIIILARALVVSWKNGFLKIMFWHIISKFEFFVNYLIIDLVTSIEGFLPVPV